MKFGWVTKNFKAKNARGRGGSLVWLSLFFLLKGINIFNFVDDARAYVCDVNLESILGKLEKNSELTLTCFGKELYETEHW